ncbi:MAG TPA: cytochrome c oxidase subunit II [Solirubrobacteraceae bacterium]|nr:cytochrome c oxidase subunit II [Solirubrobacteraceae bacterium]
MSEVHHFRRVTLIWLLASVIATPLVVFVFAPTVPPGQGSVQASGQVQDNTVLFGLSTPIALSVLVFFGYSLIVFRERNPASALEGPAIRGHAAVQLWWLIVTTSVVLFLAGYATYRTLVDGAGGGQGPNPIANPATSSTGPALQVQVIGQQWAFTYRFPGYGGVETPHLELPADRLVEFHVTSLDVVHSFWAYQLGVKADANPGFDNVAFVKTRGPLTFNIHCVELCGVWHGYMFDSGRVVPSADFTTWIKQQQLRYAPATKALPPYTKNYFPDPQRRGG